MDILVLEVIFRRFVWELVIKSDIHKIYVIKEIIENDHGENLGKVTTSTIRN